jgi:hypothetical protein
MIGGGWVMAIDRGAILLTLVAGLSGCGSNPSYPSEVEEWLSQAEQFCWAKSSSPRMCKHFMKNGAKVAALAFQNGHEQEARICVEDNKRQNGGYLDLASAGQCMIRAGVF